MPLLSTSDLTVAALQKDLAMQRHCQSLLEHQLVAIAEGLSLAINPLLTQGGFDRYTTIAGDTLQGISTMFFGSPDYWQAIAELNGVDYPYILYPGRTLRVPKYDA